MCPTFTFQFTNYTIYSLTDNIENIFCDKSLKLQSLCTWSGAFCELCEKFPDNWELSEGEEGTLNWIADFPRNEKSGDKLGDQHELREGAGF